ncbi:MAG TPA: hypothetical protein VGL77_15145 [Armatimonadota bacterium]
MRVFGSLITATLLALSISTAFAKTDTLHKAYPPATPTVVTPAMITQAKQIHEQKVIVLQHPEKMALLQAKYAAMSKAQGTDSAFAQKAPFVAKARQHEAAKHNCPYHQAKTGCCTTATKPCCTTAKATGCQK